MRFLLIGFAAAFLMLPASAPTKACEGYAASAQISDQVLAQVSATELSAAEAKDSTDAKKPVKKTAVKKKTKPKVEYMRAAPMPPGAK
jgi:hypothetical protein